MSGMLNRSQQDAAARRGRRRGVPPLAWAAVCLGLLPCGVRAADLLAPPAYPEASYDARLRLDYEIRTQGSERDQDLYGYWSASGRDLGRGWLDLYTSGRLHRDLDPPPSASFADDSFLSLDDLHGVTENRLLQLYADFHDPQGRLHLRAGRQYVDIADYIQMDGIQASLFENGRLGGAAFWGQPVSYYTSVADDTTWGLSLNGRPWTGNRTRLTYSQYDSPAGNDDNYFVTMEQELSTTLRVRGQLSVLNDRFRLGSLDGYYFAPSGETDIYFGGSRWGSFDARTLAYSPLFQVLGEQEPYTYAYARLSQVLFQHLSLMPGIAWRVSDGSAQSYANRDYRDYDLTLCYEPSRAFSASVAVDYWDLDGSDSFLSLSGEVRYRHGRRWEVSAGSSFTRYTYDTLSDISYSVNGGQTYFSEGGTIAQETPACRAYFLRARWNVNPHLALRAQGDLEDDSTAAALAYRGRLSIEVRL